jgi:putative ABC transport system permease protein
MIWQNIKNALISIASAKLRSVLTVLGIVIGVFAVIVMIGIGDGVKDQVAGQITSLGSNTLTITSGNIKQTTTAKDGKQQSSSSVNFGSAAGSSTLTNADANSVKSIANVQDVATFGIISSVVGYDKLTSNTAFIVATQPQYFSIRNLKLSSGKFYNNEDEKSASLVAVIGDTTKTNLFGQSDPIGKLVTIRGKEFKVIGVVSPTESGLSFAGSTDDIIYIPVSAADTLAGKADINRILVSVDKSENVESVRQAIEDKLKANHAGTEDFSVLTQKELLSTFDSILNILTTFVVAIAAISLLVGGIGIMNIMLVTVTERTREIGIRKALGATFGNIMGQFLTESVIISVLGGLIGLGLAYLAGFVTQRLAGITPIYSLKTLMVALGVSLFIGVVFGTAPAIKAARKRPIAALKSL